MRFLVMSMSRSPMPPEAGPALVDAMLDWVKRHSDSGKMEQVWGFAGQPGGGAILNVSSLDELDAVMAEFPFAPFSDAQVYGLTDVSQALQRVKQAMSGGAGQ